MTGPLLIGVDCGTQSIRALLVDQRGRVLALAARPTPAIVIGPGQAEYEPEALWQAGVAVLGEVARSIPPGTEVVSLACGSMGEACVLLDATDRPVGRIIAWFDRRTEPDAVALVDRIGTERLFQLTGMPLDSTLTLYKLLWHRRTDPAGFARARRMLNLADWFAFRLSGEAATDPSLASRTGCLDIGTRAWSTDLLALAELDPALLPPVRPSGSRIGAVRPEVLATIGLPGRPVVAVGGHDHVCGGFAAGAARPGVQLDSMGTAEALFRTIAAPMLTAAVQRAGFTQGAVALDRPFAYLGSGINSSGGAIEWFRDLAGGAGIAREALIAEAAAEPIGSRGVCFLPHLAYGAPPVGDAGSRGAFLGLVAGTSRGAMFRAVLEGLALEARQCVDAIAALPGTGPPEEIRVIGGNTKNPLLLAIKAAAFGRPLTVITEPEATALGAALLGGLAAGLWPDLGAALADCVQERRVIEPDPDWTSRYGELFETVYRRVYPTLAPLSRALGEFDARQSG
jgi:xylulokinase